MQEDLSHIIKKAAARLRVQDLLWALGVSGGIAGMLSVYEAADWRLLLFGWVCLAIALGLRYRIASGDAGAEQIEEAVEERLAAQRAELSELRVVKGVAHALPEPLYILDAEGVVEYANPAAEDFVGSKSLPGRHFAAVLRAPGVFEAAEAAIAAREAQAVDFVTTDSVERSCRALVTPLTDGVDDDAPSRALVFIRDLTSERRVEQMRADFIASASHELRTPLASLLGFIETLRGHAKTDPDAQEKFLSIMQSQAERMQRLVSDLMSLSRIEINEHVPPKEVVDLAEIAADVVDSLGPLFENAGAIVDFTAETDQPTRFVGEHDEVFQAIQNLLDNAVKYGGDHAMIKLRVGRGVAPSLTEGGEPGHRAGDSPAQIAARLGVSANDLLYVQIRDFGPGIERAALPRLTERFYRVNVERSRKSGGTGLGLAIVKHIMNRHKGGFQIESQLAGGTAFNCYFRAV